MPVPVPVPAQVPAQTLTCLRLLPLACCPSLSYYSLKPDIKVVAPWREWEMTSRTSMIEYAEKFNIPVPAVRACGGFLGLR